jgi:hypothetical protein
LLEPIASLCSLDAVTDLDSEAAPPVEVLRKRDPDAGSAIGANEVTALLHSLGIRPHRWVRQRAPESIPRTALERFDNGDLDASLLHGRVVFVVFSDENDAIDDNAARLAATLSSAFELPAIDAMPAWATLVSSAVCCAALAFAKRLRWHSRWLRLATLFTLGVLCTTGFAFAFDRGIVIQVPALVSGLGGCWLMLDLPRRLAERAADRSAEALLKKASRLLEMRAPEYLDDVEFWQSLARKATQAHPADNILIAELPPFSWRLKVWPNGDVDEKIIKERRRDIRRTPYSNLQGVPVASVVDDYLVMKGVPTVMIPIVQGGDVEGYLMMVGQSAADYFIDNPIVAQELAQELGSLIRKRRQLQQDNNLGPALAATSAAEQMLTSTRAALIELQLMTTLVQNAPVGLCYADPFGDVRILGKPWLKWLPQLGFEAPLSLSQNSLKSGQLPLRDLLQVLLRQVGKPAPLLSNIGSAGFSADIPLGRSETESVRTLRLVVMPLGAAGEDEGPRGFLTSLTELSSATSSSGQHRSVVPLQGDPLVVFSLSRLLQRIVSTMGGGVKLQTPREAAHVVGHRGELKDSIEAFLMGVMAEGGKAAVPVVSVKEAGDRVEVRILDLRMGVPTAALERAVLAPSAPPPGLNHLGGLVRAVENSHGRAELHSDGSWGVELELNFVRARPRIESAEAVLATLKGKDRPVRV